MPMRWFWLVWLSCWLWVSPASALPAGDAITNSRTLLRLAMPLSSQSLRELDQDLTKIEADLKYNRWGPVQGDIQKAQRWIEKKSQELLASLPADEQAQVQERLQHLQTTLSDMGSQVALHSKGKEAALADYEAALDDLEAIESHFIDPQQFVQIPPQYAHLPRLTGRAQVALKTTAGNMVITLDGYNAPLTAGNFADLVQRGFYDGIEFNRVEDFYVIQAGDPPGPAEGFVDPKTKQLRTIPLEIRIREQPQPIYGKTLEEAGFWDAEPVLPFSARGTVAMARGEDPNSASSQFFIFLAEPDLTPAGLNLIDGRYAVFGYITTGIETLDKLKLGDKILSAQLISGQEHLHS
ncbi:MAG: peptidylprolyl isomerase [Thermostichales cyanobacterium SZTDM-1c_bins_54]